MNTLLAIDQGTTGSTVLMVDENLNKLSEANHEFEQHFPHPGEVEHDLNQIWESVLKSIQKATENIQKNKILAIGITNQRETICFWNRNTGEPITRALVWQDRRTAPECKKLLESGAETIIQKKTGLVIDPYFSGTKVAWALKNIAAVKKASEAGTLAIGTIDSFLLARLTGNTVHLTEPSNASRTLAFNIHTCEWDSELNSILGLEKEIWPEVKPSIGIFGVTKNVPGLPDGIPISGILGDQQSALFGQACLKPGMAKCTYGTGSFLLMNAGKNPPLSQNRLLTTIAWQLANGEVTYALEGSAFIAGAAVQWLRDGLKLITSAAEMEPLARSVDSSDGVVFVPSLTGLGAPYWNAEATGMITGITRGTKKGHLARATLEGIAFQNADLLFAMEKDLGKGIQELRVDGGAAMNSLLMQFQADILGVKLSRPKIKETTALGALFAAGLGVGIWSDIHQIEKSWMLDEEFNPSMNTKSREDSLQKWAQAVERVNLKPLH